MDRQNIEDALRRMGVEPVSYNGEWINAHCPFAGTRHKRGTDRSPSFGVQTNPDGESIYNCFTCKTSGKFYDMPNELYKDTGNPELIELARQLPLTEIASLRISGQSYEEVMEDIPPLSEEVYGDLFPAPDDYPEAVDYLEGRDVDMRTANALGIRWWPEERRLMFPVRAFETRNLFGWTGRAIDDDAKPKVWNMKGMSKGAFILGIEHATGDRPIVCMEGLFGYGGACALGLREACDVDVVAIMGSSISESQVETLADIGQPVILFLDGDKPGRDGTWGTKDRAGNLKKLGAVHLLSNVVPVKVVTYPYGVTDPDELSGDEMAEMVRGAKPYVRRRRAGR